MSDQEVVWYYSQHGERKGPVKLEVLKSAITRNKVDREKDLVWGPGLANWVKVSEVPELQGLEDTPPSTPAVETPQVVQPLSTQPASVPVQKAQPTTPPAPEKTATPAAPTKATAPAKPTVGTSNPYETPNSSDDDNELADAMAARRMKEGSGVGIGRLKYFVYPILVSFLLGVVQAGLTGALTESAPEVLGVVVMVITVVSLLASLYFVIARLHNLSMSGWAFLWHFVPFMNFWISWRLFACPAEYHKHRKLDTAGKVLTVFYILGWLLVIGLLLAVLFIGADYYREAAEEAQRVIDAQRSEATQ